MFTPRSALTVVCLLFPAAACTSSSSSAPSAAQPTDDASTDDVGASTPKKASTKKPKDAGARKDASAYTCDPPPNSKCKESNPGSVVRGVIRFDPGRIGDVTKSGVALFLRHPWTLRKGENTIGGRLHANVYLKDQDLTTGSIPFTIDMCEYGTAMWSEENGDFNLVAILDYNGDNNIDTTTLGEIPAQTPTMGELTGMTQVRVSCHADSPCVTIQADCDKGAECTTFTPFTKVKCDPNTCPSDDSFCTK